MDEAQVMDEISSPLPGGIGSGALVIIIIAIVVVAVFAYLAFRERF